MHRKENVFICFALIQSGTQSNEIDKIENVQRNNLMKKIAKQELKRNRNK